MDTKTVRQIANQEDRYNRAEQGMLEDLEHGYDLGTVGKISWTRDNLHERSGSPDYVV
jgi:hypothetical protein